MPHAATSRETNCQREPCRFSIYGNPARRRLAAKAPSERRMARANDFCRRRKMFERKRTTFHSIAADWHDSQRMNDRPAYAIACGMVAVISTFRVGARFPSCPTATVAEPYIAD